MRANRDAVHERIERVRQAVSDGPATPYEAVPKLLGEGVELTPMMVNWGLSEVLCYLRYLELRGEAAKLEDSDPERWVAAA